jgi:hypothetical protein
MKAGKIILIAVLLIALAVGVSSFLLMKNMDRLAEDAIEEGGQKLLGTSVSLDEVNIKLLAGKARLSGLTIANPEGFSSEPAIRLAVLEVEMGTIRFEIDSDSATQEPVRINNILIRDPVVRYEIDKDGISNIDVLMQRIDDKRPSPGSDTGLMIVDRLDVKGGTISAMAAHKPGKQLDFDFPVLFMTDLGEPNGLPPEEIGAEITDALMERIMTAAQRAGVDALIDEQKDRLEDKAREKIDEKLKDLLKRN